MQPFFPSAFASAAAAAQPWGAAPAQAAASGGGAPHARIDAEKWQAVQTQYLHEAAQLWQQCVAGDVQLSDKRFGAAAWRNNPVALFQAAHHVLASRSLMGLCEAVHADDKDKSRLRFAAQQWAAAMSPSNFLALNPQALELAIQTRGQSISQGVHNMVRDAQQGHISMTDERQFEVGRNVATSEGAVVFENELFQLIEYKPLTAEVFERPFLLVPPCINKFYILDLQPENSLIRYAVSQGHRTFVLSWRNPDESLAQATWDDYIERAVITAIDTVQRICGPKPINALGFCVGGTLLSTALAVLAARQQKPVASATLLTTLVDFSDTGVLDVFISEEFVRLREAQMGQGGLLKGQELASTFSALRPTDLVWNYVVGNYLLGQTPAPFDLLYWNSDCTHLPGPFYAWYLRHAYLQNDLAKPGLLKVCGQALDMGQVDVPMYIYGSREDHIVPIGGAYASTHIFKGPRRFVMGASGHIAGVINPPAAKKRSHWVRQGRAAFPATVDEWIAGATERPGSWWPDWASWLQKHAGKKIASPKTYGKGAQYKALEPAPGRYVLTRA